MTMYEMLNSLYVTVQDTYLNLDHDCILINQGGTKKKIPLIKIEQIFVFGRVNISPYLIHYCAERNKQIVWLGINGKFLASTQPTESGGVMVKIKQYELYKNHVKSLEYAKAIVSAKLYNSSRLLQRFSRDAKYPSITNRLNDSSNEIMKSREKVNFIQTYDALLGLEGDAAKKYFKAYPYAINKYDDGQWSFISRSKRPPKDRINCLLSFGYSLLASQCKSALNGVGLDIHLGIYHKIRPGRPSLALDLMEEFRAPIIDRFVVKTLNLNQFGIDDFVETLGGGIHLNEDGKRKFLKLYEEYKRETQHVSFLNKEITKGMLPHLQARLLLRSMREKETCEYRPWQITI